MAFVTPALAEFTICRKRPTGEAFIPMTVTDNTISVLGRSVTAGELGLPASIRSYFTEEMTSVGKEAKDILAKPMELVIRRNGKQLPVTITSPLKFGKKEDGIVSWTAAGRPDHSM